MTNDNETKNDNLPAKVGFKEQLEKIFDLEPVPEPPKRAYNRQSEKDAAESAAFARDKLKKFIEIGEGMLDEAEALAKSTGDPKAIQAFNSLLKTLGEMSTNVLKNDGEKAKIDKIHNDMEKPTKPSGKTVNNNTIVFSGTADELLRQQKEQEKVIDHIPSENNK